MARLTPPPTGLLEQRVTYQRHGTRVTVGLAEWGDPDGFPILAHHGTPASRLTFDFLDEAARRRGLRIVAIDRPGMGLSDRQPGFTVVSWSRDIGRIADALGLDRFGVYGWSGGGPFALGTAAVLGDRVTKAAVFAGIGPLDTDEARHQLDDVEGRLIRLALRAPRVARTILGAVGSVSRHRPAAAVAGMKKDFGPVDAEVLDHLNETPAEIMAFFVEAFRQGAAGPVDDYRAIASPWGFDLVSIPVPVRFWHGIDDRSVPLAVGRELAAAVPGAELVALAGEGHLAPYAHADDALGWLQPDADWLHP